MKQPFLYTTSLFFVMLIAGTFWGTWFALTRTIESFTSEQFTHIGRVIYSNTATPMSIILPAGVLLMAISLWNYRDKKSNGFYLGIASLGLMLVALIVTFAVVTPVNNDINQWTTTTLPTNWLEQRNRFQTFQAVCTFSALASFALFTWSLIQDSFFIERIKKVDKVYNNEYKVKREREIEVPVH